MKVSAMRRIDRWVGVPACFGLTLWRRCSDLWNRPRATQPRPARRILIVKLAEQGATVLAYAAIRRAINMVGRENVFFLVFEENRFILDVMDLIPPENVVAMPTEGTGRWLRGTLRAVRHVRRIRPDAAVDFEFFARSSAIMTYLSGATIRVGLHGSAHDAPYRGDLMTQRVRYDPHMHTSRLYAAMVDALRSSHESSADGRAEAAPAQVPSLPEAEMPPPFRAEAEEVARVRAMVQREGRDEVFAPLVLLNPNASDLLPVRRWPKERYVELARQLISQWPDVHIALTGSPSEEAVSGTLVRAVESPRCFSMAGKTTLRELLVLYGLADVLVTNDSGPAHFASLTPIHVITLFGPETPVRFGSRSPRTQILWKQTPCSPCVSASNNRLSVCRDNQCMSQISVDEVFQCVCQALQRQSGPVSGWRLPHGP